MPVDSLSVVGNGLGYSGNALTVGECCCTSVCVANTCIGQYPCGWQNGPNFPAVQFVSSVKARIDVPSWDGAPSFGGDILGSESHLVSNPPCDNFLGGGGFTPIPYEQFFTIGQIQYRVRYQTFQYWDLSGAHNGQTFGSNPFQLVHVGATHGVNFRVNSVEWKQGNSFVKLNTGDPTTFGAVANKTYTAGEFWINVAGQGSAVPTGIVVALSDKISPSCPRQITATGAIQVKGLFNVGGMTMTDIELKSNLGFCGSGGISGCSDCGQGGGL